MLKIPYNKIIDFIEAQTSLTKQEIEEKIQEKLRQFSNILSREGAALLVANELKINFSDFNNIVLKVNEFFETESANVKLKVIRDNGISEFVRKDGQSGRVRTYFASDETGTTRIVLWNDLIDQFHLEEQTIYEIKNVRIKKNNNSYEVHLTSKSEINELEKIKNEEKSRIRKRIIEIQKPEDVETLGIIVKIFEPKTFKTCKICKRRVENFCQEHPNEIPETNYVVTLILDDATDSIRVVLFKEVFEIIGSLENLNNLLGKILFVRGKVSINDKFNTKDLIAKDVKIINDPDEAISLLKTFIY
ncbi:MAG: DUF2240 family protein [Candidatus Woesearchaeota archaeon]